MTPESADDLAVALIKDWYESEPERRRSRIGIPNVGLHLLEVFRSYWPLRESYFLTHGGGQVAGLSGSSGDTIISRYANDLRSLGTEAGRTSRSTPEAARRLATRLNGISATLGSHAATRRELADVMQRWLIENVLRDVLTIAPTRLAHQRGRSIRATLEAYISEAIDDRAWELVVRELCLATVRATSSADVRVPSRSVDDAAEFYVGDTGFVIERGNLLNGVARCRAIVSEHNRCVMLTGDDVAVGAAQVIRGAGVDRVIAESATRFLELAIEQAAGFDSVTLPRIVTRINETLAR